jgi:hypothetical protein
MIAGLPMPLSSNATAAGTALSGSFNASASVWIAAGSATAPGQGYPRLSACGPMGCRISLAGRRGGQHCPLRMLFGFWPRSRCSPAVQVRVISIASQRASMSVTPAADLPASAHADARVELDRGWPRAVGLL